jgi:hypothetical protein
MGAEPRDPAVPSSRALQAPLGETAVDTFNLLGGEIEARQLKMGARERIEVFVRGDQQRRCRGGGGGDPDVIVPHGPARADQECVDVRIAIDDGPVDVDNNELAQDLVQDLHAARAPAPVPRKGE